MKPILITTKIIIIIGYMLSIGFFAGAELSSEESSASPLVIEDNMKNALVNQQASYDHSASRKGFSSVYITPEYYPNFGLLAVNIAAGYGVVSSGSFLFPKGIMEMEGAMDVYYSGILSFLSVHFKTEYNFMPNDGIHTMIPGLDIPITITLPDFSNIGSNIGIGMGLYLKAFISKQFALIPRVGINYSVINIGAEVQLYNVKLKTSINTLTLQLGLGIRHYF